jgi:hypothetical protein
VGTGRLPMGKVLLWLLGVSLCGFLVLMAAGVYDILTGSQLFVRATPTPAFLAGAEVKLVERGSAAVTVWQVGGGCEVGLAFGQVPSGSDARVLEDACYNREHRAIFYRITLSNGSTGWVEANSLVLAAEYKPPTPTEPPGAGSTSTPWPSSTPGPTPESVPTQTLAPAPLPVGSVLYTNNLGIRVDRVEIADALSSPAGDKTEEAEGRFALVFLTVTNQGSRSKTLHASSVYIEDAAGHRYSNDDQASAYASSVDCLDYVLDIGPGESVCMVAAVDISAEGDYYVLGLQGADERVLLDLP